VARGNAVVDRERNSLTAAWSCSGFVRSLANGAFLATNDVDDCAYGNQRDVVQYEAELVARTIHAAIAGAHTVPRSAKEKERGAEPGATAGDFLIIARNKGHLSIYGQKLQELGIACQITGGTSLNEVRELRLLYTCLSAVTRPDDPVAQVAVCGDLFEISDADLYAFKLRSGLNIHERCQCEPNACLWQPPTIRPKIRLGASTP
jgi:ATP-dependent exoDNAse (exonuclease V) beta subunit